PGAMPPGRRNAAEVKGEGRFPQRDFEERNPYFKKSYFAAFLAAATLTFTCLVKFSLAASKLPLASWPSASLVLTVTLRISWPFAYNFSVVSLTRLTLFGQIVLKPSKSRTSAASDQNSTAAATRFSSALSCRLVMRSKPSTARLFALNAVSLKLLLSASACVLICSYMGIASWVIGSVIRLYTNDWCDATYQL